MCAKIDHHLRRVIATKTKGVKKVRKRIGRRSQEYSLAARVTMLNQHFLYLLRFTPFDHTEETLFHFLEVTKMDARTFWNLQKMIMGWSNIFARIVWASYLEICLFVSNAIEFRYTNPAVHMFHNCPDIAGMAWKHYRWYHAGLTGVTVSWWLVYPALLVIPYNVPMILYCGVMIIACPIIYKGDIDIYAGHKALYAWIPIHLILGAIIKVFFLKRKYM